MPSLEIALFGGVRMLVDGQPVTLPYDKVRALLAYLLIEARDFPQRRETLAGLLWPEQTEKEARHSLSQALLKLRQAVDVEGELLSADRHSVGWLTTPPHKCDAVVFSRQRQQWQTHSHAQPDFCESCMARRETAVALYTGPFLAGLSLPDAPEFEQWLTRRREQFQQQAMDQLATLTTYHEWRAELAQASRYAQQQITLEPWCEEAHYQLMRLMLYRGQRSSAIAQYHTCAQTLAVELGLEPAAKTKALFRLIQSANPQPPNNIPVETTPFVGREPEISQITGWLAGPHRRLITIAGPGGIGKTRLAQAIAQRQLGRPTEDAIVNSTTYAFFTHGIYWVSLVGVETAVALGPTIAETLGLQLEQATETPIRTVQQQLLDYLRQKRILLILDNFEQLLTTEAQEATAMVNAILRHAQDVQLLVTSRERLQLPQEQLFPLHGLDYPETEADKTTEYTAAALFLHSARRIQPALQLDQEGQAAVAQICRLLQGMPLALELAATASNILAPAELAAELAQSLDLLTTTMRHLPERHRSMRAAFATSWQRLSATEQSVFQQLSLFRGGFDRAAARAVAEASMPILNSLANKSFIQFRQDSQRYEIHELMRQFGKEKLTTSTQLARQTSQRHSAYFAARLQQWAAEVKGAQQQKAFQQMALNSDNIRLAWHWLVDHALTDLLAQAIDGPGFLYQTQGRYREGAELYQKACQMLRALTKDRANCHGLLVKALTWLGLFLHNSGDSEAAHSLLAEALGETKNEMPGDAQRQAQDRAQAFLWHTLGNVLLNGSQRHKAQAYLDKSLAAYSSVGDSWGQGQVNHSLGILARELGDYATAGELIKRSLDLRQKISDQRGIADSLGWLGLIAMDMGDLDRAEALMLEQLVLERQLKTTLGVTLTLDRLGLLHLFRGQFAEAQDMFTERLAILDNLGMQQQLGMTKIWLGIAQFNQGMYREAETNAQASLALVTKANSSWTTAQAKMLLGYVKLALGETDAARQQLKSAIALFQQLGQRDELSQAQAWLAYVHLADGDLKAAQTCLTNCLRTAVEIRTVLPVMLALPAVARLFFVKEDMEMVLEMDAMARQIPGLANSVAFADLVGQPGKVAAELLPTAVVAAAQERGQHRELWATATELLAHYTKVSYRKQR